MRHTSQLLAERPAQHSARNGMQAVLLEGRQTSSGRASSARAFQSAWHELALLKAHISAGCTPE